MGGIGSGNYSRAKHLDFEELIKRSLDIQLRFFKNPDISDEKKVEYASRYLVKKVGERIDLSIEHTLNPIQISELKEKILQLKKSESSSQIEYIAEEKSDIKS